MGKIRVYEQQVDFAPAQANPNQQVYAPTESAKASGALGRSIAQTSTTIVDAFQKREEANNISDGGAELAKINDEFTSEYETALDESVNGDGPPRDPKQFATEFMTKYEKRIAEARSKMTTQAGQHYFDRSSTQMHSQFVQKAAATAGELARAKATNNYNTQVTTLSAKLMRSPDDFEYEAHSMDTTLDPLVGRGFTQSQVDKLKQHAVKELAIGAIKGRARIGPEGPALAKKELDSGQWDTYGIGQQEKDTLYADIKGEANARFVEAGRIKKIRDDARKEHSERLFSGFLSQMAEKPGSVSPLDITRSAMDPEKKLVMIHEIDRQNKEGGDRHNWPMFNSLLARSRLPEGDPRKITDSDSLLEYVYTTRPGEQVPLNDIKQIQEVMNSRKTPEGRMVAVVEDKFLVSAAAAITGSLIEGNRGEAGTRNYAQFLLLVEQKKEAQRKAGKPLIDLFDKSKPEYLGPAIDGFRRTQAEQLQDMLFTQGMGPNREEQNSTPVETGAPAAVPVEPSVEVTPAPTAAPAPAPKLPGGMVERGNIDLSTRPKVKNGDGTISTIRSISVNIDGKEILIPTVSDDGKILSDKKAVELYKETGKHLGIFENAASATAFAKKLHDAEARKLEIPVTEPAPIGWVWVVDPDGNPGLIPQSQLTKAFGKGYKRK